MQFYVSVLSWHLVSICKQIEPGRSWPSGGARGKKVVPYSKSWFTKLGGSAAKILMQNPEQVSLFPPFLFIFIRIRCIFQHRGYLKPQSYSVNSLKEVINYWSECTHFVQAIEFLWTHNLSKKAECNFFPEWTSL